MLDSTKTYFFGVARDIDDYDDEKKKGPTPCPYAPNDLVYYYPPGDRKGKIANVKGYYYTEEGNLRINIKLIATGEEITTSLGRLRC